MPGSENDNYYLLLFFFSGFTPLVLKELRKLTSLKEFNIEYDSICKVDLFDCLPSTLTHLTLSRCNISLDKFNYLMSTGTQKTYRKNENLFSIFRQYQHASLAPGLSSPGKIICDRVWPGIVGGTKICLIG